VAVKIFPGDPGRVATVLPGLGYSPVAPLLFNATALLIERGWTVQQVWWEDAERTSADAALGQARRALDAVTAPLHLVIAKSLGTFAMPIAAERGLPGVWLTPILTDASNAAAVPRLSAHSLLVGGTTDRTWDADVAREGPGSILELAGADHSLQIATSVGESVEALRAVTRRMAHFIDELPD
jgi:hypothetical protein